MKLISVDKSLPKNGETVLVKETRGGGYNVATFYKGLSKKDRKLMEYGTIPPVEVTYTGVFDVYTTFKHKAFSSADENGNNKKPYQWQTRGPLTYFGQDISHWAYIDL